VDRSGSHWIVVDSSKKIKNPEKHPRNPSAMMEIKINNLALPACFFLLPFLPQVVDFHDNFR
jgi:hypothetical protein